MTRAQPNTAEQGHNSGGHLRAFVERIERLEEEIKTLNADKSDIYQEAKGTGFDVKVLRKVVAARRMDRAERQEAEALYDLYMTTLENAENGLVRARVENIEVLPPHDIETGELIEPDLSEPTSSPAETDSPAPTSSRVPDGLPEMPPAEPSVAHTEAGKSDGDRNPVDVALVTSRERPAQDFPAPQTPVAHDGEPGVPSSDDGGAKMAGVPETLPGRAASAGTIDVKSEQAVTPFTEDDVPAFLKPPRPPQKPLREGCLTPECCASWKPGLCHGCEKAAAAKEAA